MKSIFKIGSWQLVLVLCLFSIGAGRRLLPEISIISANLRSIRAAQTSNQTLVLEQPPTSSLQARVLAFLDPVQASLWLQKGPSDSASGFNDFQLCITYWKTGFYDEAVAACHNGTVPAKYWINQGLQAEQAGELGAAVAAYEMAVAMEPDSATAWFRLGHIQFAQADFASSVSAHVKGLASGYTGGSNAHEELGRAYMKLGDLVAAEMAFSAGLEQYPNSRPLFYDMVDLARQKQDWAQADAWLARLSANWPEEIRPWLLRGEIALQQGNAAGALDYYQQATRLEPDNPSAWAGVGQAAARLNDLPTATAAFIQLMAFDPANPGILLQAGEFFYQQQLWDEARIAFTRTLELDPDNQQAQTRLAEIDANE